MVKRHIAILAIIFSALIYTSAYPAYSPDIKLKVAIVNPSDTDSQTSPIRYDLPKGIGPDEISDPGELTLKYDMDKGNYYLYGIVKLKPSEKKVLEVGVKDVWSLPVDEIESFVKHTREMDDKLKGTKHAAVGDTLSKKIVTQLDNILKKEKATDLGIKERINNYYENSVALKSTKEEIGMLENLVIDTGGVVAERVSIPTTLAMSIEGVNSSDIKNTVNLTVTAKNPSPSTRQFVDVKYNLPAEVTPKDVAGTDGLEVGYDFRGECFNVYQQKVDLRPGETKTFVVKLRDIWRVPGTELDSVNSHTKNLIVLLEGTERAAQAKPIADKIFENTGIIEKTQNSDVGAEKHITYYRDNTKLFKTTKDYVAQLEKMITQAGVSPGVTVQNAEKLKGGGVESRRPRGYEGVDMVAKSVFRGKAPSVATTWKIIFAILVFLGILGALFFGLWYSKLMKKE